MKIKTNDKVKITTGKDKGKSGKVTRVVAADSKVVVEGLNVVKKHIKSGKDSGKGQRIEVAMPLNVSNVTLVCPNCSKETRVEYMILESGEKHRICKKCKQTIDSKVKDK
ncbi:MAG: 50S ribosomal protein L24 [Candidatus Pacebacteria bacterium]|nr:50S ribosomal protein L24 [Candidatus Paceibacterota bacterium]